MDGFFVVDSWGAPLGHGTAADPRWCTLSGVAKINGPGAPYAVANEYICGRLALMLGLPVPPGVLVESEDGGLAYVCLRFGRINETPPPTDAVELVADNPWMAAAIVAFDCWIGNADRHPGNVAYSRTFVPLAVFDHSHALLGWTAGEGVDRLRTEMDEPLGYHCISPELTTARDLVVFSERISGLADEVIREVCREVARPGGATSDETLAAAEFLLNRKKRVYDLLQAGKTAMPKIADW